MDNWVKFFGLVGVVALSAVTHAHAASVMLVENGVAKSCIVVAADCSEQTQRAARELQGYIERISGARLEIHSESGPTAGLSLFVGESNAVRGAGVEVPAGFTHAMNEEGYVIRAIPGGIVLAGNEDGPYQGTLYAVYDFLERLGCRWFFPGEYGEVVPRRETIDVQPISVVERPDFRFRNIWYSGWMPVSPEQAEAFSVWRDRNRMTSLAGLSLPGDGSITRLAPADTYFETEPEIYALTEEGERMKDMLCLTEPKAVTIAVKTITEEFRAHPEQWTFGFAPPDGHPRCFCERCKAAEPGFSGLGFGDPSLSDTWFQFANAVAKEVYKEFPDRWLFTNGYANRVRPPEGVGPLSPNLGIQSAMLHTCTFHRIDDPRCFWRQIYKTVLDRWTRDLNCVFIYDYDPGKSLDNLPFPNLHTLSNDMRYYKDRGVWGFWTEGNNNWMVTHLNYYVRSKLMWDSNADVKALVRDYCEKFYGNAARPIEQYIWTLERAVDESDVHTNWGRIIPWRAVLPDETLRKLDSLVARAIESTAGADDVARTHVNVIKLTHDHMRAMLEMEECAARVDFTSAVAHADKMESIRGEVAQIDPGLLPHTPDWAREHSGTLESFRATYRGLADQCDGTKGDLVVAFPSEWEFKTDPLEVGTLEQWYLRRNGGDWETISDSVYWDAQGLQRKDGLAYDGHAWYRGTVTVPASVTGRPVRLTIGGVYSDNLWLWLNGNLIDHRKRQRSANPFDIDVTAHVRTGETNHLAILVDTIPAGHMPRGGLHRRVFLWSSR